MPKTVPQEVVRDRLSIVAEAIARFGWSQQIEGQLAERLGVHRRTIRQYKKRALEGVAAHYFGEGRELAQAQWFAELQGGKHGAREDRSWGGFASLMGLEGKALGVFEKEDEQRQPASIDAVLEQVQQLPESVKAKLRAALAEVPALPEGD